MQIVVTLSEREYNLMKHFIEHGMGNAPMEAICNGQVLPKGHGRLIDENKLLENLKESANHHADNSREESLLYRDRVIVREQPTIIEADMVVESEGEKWH